MGGRSALSKNKAKQVDVTGQNNKPNERTGFEAIKKVIKDLSITVRQRDHSRNELKLLEDQLGDMTKTGAVLHRITGASDSRAFVTDFFRERIGQHETDIVQTEASIAAGIGSVRESFDTVVAENHVIQFSMIIRSMVELLGAFPATPSEFSKSQLDDFSKLLSDLEGKVADRDRLQKLKARSPSHAFVLAVGADQKDDNQIDFDTVIRDFLPLKSSKTFGSILEECKKEISEPMIERMSDQWNLYLAERKALLVDLTLLVQTVGIDEQFKGIGNSTLHDVQRLVPSDPEYRDLFKTALSSYFSTSFSGARTIYTSENEVSIRTFATSMNEYVARVGGAFPLGRYYPKAVLSNGRNTHSTISNLSKTFEPLRPHVNQTNVKHYKAVINSIKEDNRPTDFLIFLELTNCDVGLGSFQPIPIPVLSSAAEKLGFDSNIDIDDLKKRSQWIYSDALNGSRLSVRVKSNLVIQGDSQAEEWWANMQHARELLCIINNILSLTDNGTLDLLALAQKQETIDRTEREDQDIIFRKYLTSSTRLSFAPLGPEYDQLFKDYEKRQIQEGATPSTMFMTNMKVAVRESSWHFQHFQALDSTQGLFDEISTVVDKYVSHAVKGQDSLNTAFVDLAKVFIHPNFRPFIIEIQDILKKSLLYSPGYLKNAFQGRPCLWDPLQIHE